MLLLSQGELVDLSDSSVSQRRAVTCGGERQDHRQGVVQEDIKIKIKTYSPALNQESRLILSPCIWNSILMLKLC